MDSSECLPYETRFEVQWWRFGSIITSTRQCFRLSSVYVVEISWRVDRAAKAKACNIIIIIEDDDYHKFYSYIFYLQQD